MVNKTSSLKRKLVDNNVEETVNCNIFWCLITDLRQQTSQYKLLLGQLWAEWLTHSFFPSQLFRKIALQSNCRSLKTLIIWVYI